METKLTGPILTEEELFDLLDGSVPAFAEAKKAAKEGNLTDAKHIFAEQVRHGGYSELYFENRERMKAYSPVTNEEKLAASCEKILDHELTSCGFSHKFGKEVDWFSNPTYNKYSEWTWQLSRHHDIFLLAQAYERFGDEKYAECAVELLSSWWHQAIRPEADVGDGATLCWRTIECGNRMTVWPNIVFPLLKSPAATDDFICELARSLYEHGPRLIRSKTHNNWRNIELGGLASLSVLFPFFEESKAWREHTANGTVEHLVRQIHPDGFQFELSTTYHGVVLVSATHAAKMLALAGYKMPDEFYRVATSMYEMYVKLRQSGDIIPNINDGRSAHIRSYLPRDGFCADSELVKWALDGCPADGAPKMDSLSFFEYAGLAILRDSFAGAKCSVFFDAGKIGRSHQHEDKLNVLVYHNGKELLTEGHNYSYDTSDIRKYILSTFSHNTVTVDGEGQNRKKGFKWDDAMLTVKEPVRTFTSDTLDFAAGKYDEAYGEEQQITDVVHTREVALVKKPAAGDGTVIVIDTLSGDTEHGYEAIWHVDTDELALDGNVALGDSFSLAFGADVGELRIVKGQTEPTVQGFTARSTVQGDYDAIPTVLNKITAKCATMLTVISLGAKVRSASLDGRAVKITYENGKCEEVELP